MVALGGDSVIRGYEGEIEAYRDAHLYKEATGVAAEAAKAMPRERGVQLMYAFQLAISGEPDKGVALANAQLNGGPDDRDTLVQLSNIELELHRFDAALGHLEKADALSTRPEEHGYIALLRATVLDRDKKYDAAEVAYKQALAVDPNNPTVLNDYGYMLADRGTRLQEALVMVKKAVEIEPQNGSYLDSLGWVYFKLGQYAQGDRAHLDRRQHPRPPGPGVREDRPAQARGRPVGAQHDRVRPHPADRRRPGRRRQGKA
jgi:Flp pilus assembly protein TadD